MLRIRNEYIQLFLHAPEDGFYLGTRFDRSGIFDSMVFRGAEMCGRWFEKYDPRIVSFPFAPEGTWRADYDSVAFSPDGVRFNRTLLKGESVYSGDIHARGQAGMPYVLSLREGPVQLRIRGDVPVTHTVFWANHRIACPEPYNRVSAGAGETFSWSIEYKLDYED